MYDCELLQKGEKQINLLLYEEEDVDNITAITRYLKAFKELAKIVKPLAIESIIICQVRVSLLNINSI